MCTPIPSDLNNLPQDAGTSNIEAVVAALHLASTDEEVEVPDGWWAGSLRLMMMKLLVEIPLNDASGDADSRESDGDAWKTWCD